MKTPSAGQIAVALVAYGGVFSAATVLGGLGYFHFASPSRTCASCHEMGSVHATWGKSSHQSLHCRECHGGALTLDVHALQSHGRRVVRHFGNEDDATPVRLTESHVQALHAACQRCHPQAYADWKASGHATTFSRLFTNAEQNRMDPPAEDCLRCHGQFVDGGIATVVQRTTADGTWQLVDSRRADQPAIPCLSCHQVHAPRAETPLASFYSRREQAHIPADLLPVVRMRRADADVRVARDVRQRLCQQCHTANAAHALGSSDDRTPAGVHEGLSCRDCHTSHTNSARKSCSACHPADSHCGLDVETMDTTFRSPDSKHDIHTVSCTDCHVAQKLNGRKG